MEHAIPSLIVGAVLLVASSFLARSGLHAYDQLALSLKEMEARLGEQSKTRLSISGVSVSGGGATLTVSLRNDGQTRIAAFERLDVILTYFDSPTTRLTLWLPYNAGAPQADSWRLASITDDTYEPGILNPGETAQIEIGLAAPVQPGTSNFIVIGSDTGSTATSTFTG